MGIFNCPLDDVMHDRDSFLTGSLSTEQIHLIRMCLNSNLLKIILFHVVSCTHLQIFGVVVSPCEQHGSKQVPSAHKHGVHLRDVNAYFLSPVSPIWFNWKRAICVLVHCDQA